MNGFSKILCEWAARVGFPVAVATALLWMQFTRLDQMNQKLERVITILEVRR